MSLNLKRFHFVVFIYDLWCQAAGIIANDQRWFTVNNVGKNKKYHKKYKQDLTIKIKIVIKSTFYKNKIKIT